MVVRFKRESIAGAINDEDFGHASADLARPAGYDRNFSPSGDMVLDFSR